MDFFTGLADVYANFAATPFLYLIIGLALLPLILWRFSLGTFSATLKAIYIGISNIFHAPFDFFRDGLSLLRSVKITEKDYQHSRAFFLFRFTHFYYLGIILSSVFILAAGFTIAITSVYPRLEISEHQNNQDSLATAVKMKSDALQRLTQLLPDWKPTGSSGNNTSSTAGPSSGYNYGSKNRPSTSNDSSNSTNSLTSAISNRRGLLSSQKENTARTLRTATTLFEQAKSNNPRGFQGGMLNIISQIRRPEQIAELRDRLRKDVNDCQSGNTRLSPSLCSEFEAYTSTLLEKQKDIILKRDDYENAEKDFNQFDSSVREAQQSIARSEAQEKAAQDALDADDISTSSWLFAHLRTFASLIATTFGLFIGYVWGAAILADLISWFTLFIRTDEKRRLAKMSNSTNEYSS
jgi:hypothetical protein